MLEVSLYWGCVKSYRWKGFRFRSLRFRCKGLRSERFWSSVGCFIMHFMLEALIPLTHRSLLLRTVWLFVLLMAVESGARITFKHWIYRQTMVWCCVLRSTHLCCFCSSWSVSLLKGAPPMFAPPIWGLWNLSKITVSCESQGGSGIIISHLCSVCWTKSLWDLRPWPPRPEMKYFRWEILGNRKPEMNWENPFPPSRKLPNSLKAKFGWKGMLKAGALNPPGGPPCLSWASSIESDLPSAEKWEIFSSDLVENHPTV